MIRCRRPATPCALFVLAALLVAGADPLAAQSPARTTPMEPARFADPDRIAKPSSAFGEIDRLFRAYAARAHPRRGDAGSARRSSRRGHAR